LSKETNTANKSLFCGGDTLSLHVSSSNNSDVSYNWFKDGTKIGTTSTPSFEYPFTDASGSINLSATSEYNNGCQSTVSNVIPVQKRDVNFSISMDSNPVAYCPEVKKINLFDYISGTDKNDVMTQSNNCSYEFTASGNNGLAVVSYSFLDLDNSTSALNPYTLTFNVNKQGCVKSFTKDISIKPRPVTPLIALTSNNELRFCGGDVTSFFDQNAVTGTYYKWDVNGTEIDGTSTLKYPTNITSNLQVSTIAYLTSNSCPSKLSNVLNVSNVLPQVEIKLIKTDVTVNDNIQFFIYEPATVKSITLKATRVSDNTISDLDYTREGNVITLTGILPIGTYTFNAVAENVLSGYCSQYITVPEQLTVTQNTGGETPDNAALKAIYDEYMVKLTKGDVHSLLLPILTSKVESAKLCIFTNYENEYVNIHVCDMVGKEVYTVSSYLTKGETDFTIDSNQKPIVPGMYLINIEYTSAGRTETLKGLIKN
ncbi:MAG TPA: hypothetical protein VFD03_06390, partial [Clostridia bacterium]|nr:hypothetical protein [Clostridia bacterium]